MPLRRTQRALIREDRQIAHLCPPWVKLRNTQDEQMSSALAPIADIPGHCPLRAFGVVRESVTLAHPTGIRTCGKFGFKLSLWRFTFLNYTKSTKYEALEKNAVSRRQIA